jgi:DNA-binding Lrp family transcriptional regulator
MKHKRIKKLINGTMNKLDRDDYEILYELYFNNASIHHLSKKLGIRRPAVRYRRAKALERLKQIIETQTKN